MDLICSWSATSGQIRASHQLRGIKMYICWNIGCDFLGQNWRFWKQCYLQHCVALAEQEDDDSSANDSGRKTPSAPSGSRVAAGFYLFFSLSFQTRTQQADLWQRQILPFILLLLPVLAHVEQIFSCAQGSVYLVSFISLFLVVPQSIQTAIIYNEQHSSKPQTPFCSIWLSVSATIREFYYPPTILAPPCVIKISTINELACNSVRPSNL